MELNHDRPNSGDNQINRYDPNAGVIIVNGRSFMHSLLLSPHKIEAWPPQTLEALEAKNFLPVLAMKPEVILLGTGPSQAFPATEILAPCIKANIAVETMDTAAACRTFNLLALEGRNVVAALLK